MTPDAFADDVLTDQLTAIRQRLFAAIPVKMAVGAAVTLVAWQANHLRALEWYIVALSIGLFRLFLCKWRILPPKRDQSRVGNELAGVKGQLRLHLATAFLSGLVWAYLPFLTADLQSPQTLFYLIVTCGITAGAVTQGFAYSGVPIVFILPPLLAVGASLFRSGTPDHLILCVTITLYLCALIRGAQTAEFHFKNESRLKHEATALSRSLETANMDAKALARTAKIKASQDLLTGLLNRRGFLEILQADSGKSGDCVLLLLDLDGFKSVNDVFGHIAGDEILVEIGNRIALSSPEASIKARLGGDEFAIYLMQSLTPETPETLALRLIDGIAAPFLSRSIKIGCSIGVYVGPNIDLEEMLSSADAALYEAKNQGRNRFRVYDEKLKVCSEIHRDIERELHSALENEEIEIWLQPIMGNGGRKLESFEALLRWEHHKHGWISPPQILKAAAFTGLSEKLFSTCLNQATDALTALEAVGLGDVRIAINISPREMAQLPVDDIISERLLSLGIPGDLLEVEITEETAIDMQAILGKLQKLSSLGVAIAIDDFGTGYSSLALLRQLKADRVKIDRAFISEIAYSPSDAALVAAVLKISAAFGFDVVAEGVETEEDRERVAELGCEFMQGYLFAKPMPLRSALVWAKKQISAECEQLV